MSKGVGRCHSIDMRALQPGDKHGVGSMTRRLNVTPGGCLFYDQDKEGYTVIGAKAIAANYEVIQKQSLGLDEYNLSASDGRNRRKENPGAAAEFG